MPIKRLLLIMAVALGLRCWGLSWGLPTAARPVCHYPDDYTVIWLLSNMKPAEHDYNPRYFHNPTFFYYQVGALLKASSVVGIVPAGKDKAYFQEHREAYTRLYFIGRCLVVFYSLLALLMIYALTAFVFDERAGLWAASCWAILPIAVYSSQCLEVSTPLVFWAGSFMLACLASARNKSVKQLYIASVLYGLTISTKYLALPLLLPLFLAHYLVTDKLFSFAMVKMALISVFFFFLGTPYALVDFHSFTEGFMFSFRASGLKERRHWNFGPLHLGYSMGWPLFLLAFGGMVHSLWKKNLSSALMASFIVAFVLLLSAATKQVTRYYLMPAFFLLPFAGNLLRSLWDFRRSPALGKVFVAAILLPSLFLTVARCSTMANDPDPRDVSSGWVKEHIPVGSSIGMIWEPLWYTPGVLFTEYRKQTGIEAGPANYKIYVGDPQKDPPWTEGWPDFIVLNDDEWKMYAAPDKRCGEWPPVLPGYKPVITWRRVPHIGSFEVKKCCYQSYEWFNPFPILTVWEKEKP